jgi:tRNA pseudouridine38-40 synthase
MTMHEDPSLSRNLKITLSYDGSEFRGWQVQPGLATIQGTLAEVIGRISGENVLPQGSGRTDTGVHALAQVATFTTQSPIPVENLCKALNDKLPLSIRVTGVQEVASDFHARHSAKRKTYRYRIFRGSVCPPFLWRYVTHYPFPLSEDAVFRSAEYVLGEHDFTSFAAVDPDRMLREAEFQDDRKLNPRHTTAIRTVYESVWKREGDELIYTITGNGFLHHMVRNLVGTFLLAGKGTIQPEDVRNILQARNRSAAAATAPANGLYLVSVDY